MARALIAPFFCFSHSHYPKIIPLASRSIIVTKPSIPCKFTISLFVCVSRILTAYRRMLLSSLVCTKSYGSLDAFWRVHSVLVNLPQPSDATFCRGSVTQCPLWRSCSLFRKKWLWQTVTQAKQGINGKRREKLEMCRDVARSVFLTYTYGCS